MSGEPRDGELEVLVSATRAELDEHRRAAPPLPDFAAMLERARELDASRVDEDALAQARALAPVVSMHARPEPSAGLEPFTAALRAELDARVAGHRAREIPPPSFLGRPRRALVRRRSWGWAAGLALLLLGGVAAAMVGGGRWWPAQEPDARGDQVRRSSAGLEPVDPQPTGGAGSTRSTPVPEPDPDPAPDPQVAPPEAREPDGTGPEAALAVSERAGGGEVGRDRAGAPRRRAARRDRGASKASPPAVDPLAELDARAQARWQAGDLDGAEQLYAEIVRRGGRGRWAELAYAELFALAARHPASARERLWREYLASFADGRYAEDARAGLCRGAKAGERRGCWTEYLDHHPQGTHTSEARAALGLDDPPP